MARDQLMWIEDKGGDEIVGPARIGYVTPSKSGRSLHYRGRTFQTLRGSGFKANYFDVETGRYYWISACRKDGMDALYSTDVEIDEDAREAYWLEVRQRPDLAHVTSFRATGKLTASNGPRMSPRRRARSRRWARRRRDATRSRRRQAVLGAVAEALRRTNAAAAAGTSAPSASSDGCALSETSLHT